LRTPLSVETIPLPSFNPPCQMADAVRFIFFLLMAILHRHCTFATEKCGFSILPNSDARFLLSVGSKPYKDAFDCCWEQRRQTIVTAQAEHRLVCCSTRDPSFMRLCGTRLRPPGIS
jgi:hypothetical protein